VRFTLAIVVVVVAVVVVAIVACHMQLATKWRFARPLTCALRQVFLFLSLPPVRQLFSNKEAKEREREGQRQRKRDEERNPLTGNSPVPKKLLLIWRKFN